jgi:hypothetical protein
LRQPLQLSKEKLSREKYFRMKKDLIIPLLTTKLQKKERIKA